MQEVLIEIDKVTKKFYNSQRETTVLKELCFSVYRGEFLAITGKSGSGKSTLLSIMAGLDPPTSGGVRYSGENLYEKPEKELERFRVNNIGIVFQNYNLINELTCLDNIELPLFFAKKKRYSDGHIKRIVDCVDLNQQTNLLPAQMSGGEQQRTAVARAIINEPAVLFADEPTGSLDTANREIIIKLLEGLRKTKNTTVVIITHDLEIADRCDRKLVIQDGTLVQ